MRSVLLVVSVCYAIKDLIKGFVDELIIKVIDRLIVINYNV